MSNYICDASKWLWPVNQHHLLIMYLCHFCAHRVWMSADPFVLCRPLSSSLLWPGTFLPKHFILKGISFSLLRCCCRHPDAGSLLSLVLLQIEIRDTKDPRFGVQRFHWEPQLLSSSSSFLPPLIHPPLAPCPPLLSKAFQVKPPIWSWDQSSAVC